MTIGKLEGKLGVWQFFLRASTNDPQRFGFHPYVAVWFIKLKILPKEGELIIKKQYDGFHFFIRMPIPTITQAYRTKPIGYLLGLDKRQVPKWIPKRLLMQDWKKGYSSSVPRPGVIAFLSKQFTIPTKIKLL